MVSISGQTDRTRWQKKYGERAILVLGPSWPRHISLLHSNTPRNQTKHNKITSLVLLPAAWALVRSKLESFLLFLRVMSPRRQDGILSFCFSTTESQHYPWPCSHWLGLAWISKCKQKKAPFLYEGWEVLQYTRKVRQMAQQTRGCSSWEPRRNQHLAAAPLLPIGFLNWALWMDFSACLTSFKFFPTF